MILYTENHKDYTHTYTQPLELMYEFSKVTGYEIEIQKCISLH